MQSESVRVELDRQLNEVRAKLFEEARTELDSSFEAQQAELARLGQDVDERQRRLTQLDEDLRSKQREIDETVASFDREVTLRLEEIARRPEAAFAENAILRAALLTASKPIRERSAAENLSSFGIGVTVPQDASADYLKDEEAVRREFARRTLTNRTSPYAALALHAALLAGTVPVVIGDKAFDLLGLYASVVANGRLHWIPAGSSLLEPQDLLGRFDSSLRRIVPHPAGLLDVIQDAKRTGRMHVVVLDGFNRAPVEAYLLPILEAAAAGRRDDPSRAIPLASPAILSSDDPYRESSKVVWPPSVLLACIPAHGTATLPVPLDVWRRLTVIDADDRERPALPLPAEAASGKPIGATELAADLWLSLTELESADYAKSDPKSKEVFERFAGLCGLSAVDIRTAMDVHRALCRNKLSITEAQGLAVVTTLVPRTTAPEKTLEESLKKLGAAQTLGWRPIHSEAERLRA
jgi:hypothetical protein